MKDIKKSISAGFMIGIGSTVYLICENKILGALFFSIGLFIICSFGMNLFTGKIGYVFDNKNNPNCFKIWVGNIIGCLLCVVPIRLIRQDLSLAAITMVQNKLNNGIINIIVSSVFCGILMYLAVENYTNNKNDFAKIIGIFLCVFTFIICGFEHSIANVCYCIFTINTPFMGIQSLMFIIIVSISNSLGAIICRQMTKINGA